LQNGDQLSRAEFERRFDATPDLKKAELIEGVVYMPPPVSHSDHGVPHFRVIGWLDRYCEATPGIDGGDNGSLRLDLENMPQPDAYLFILPELGGQAEVDADGYVAGAPELIVEVAASSVSYDLNVKLKAYQRNGVCEYVVWRVLDDALDWFVLREGRYEPLAPKGGVFRSENLPGLWLDVAGLLNADRAKVSEVLRRGIASPQHAAFVARLKAIAAKRGKQGKPSRPVRRGRHKRNGNA
jgi:Uma2 family endonuclease